LTLEKHLSKKDLSTLGSITEILKEYPYSKLVEGHTDDRRSNEMNQTLSEKLQL
jgi:outer membrane protein OmpA-like peptidoglycan-associated protein